MLTAPRQLHASASVSRPWITLLPFHQHLPSAVKEEVTETTKAPGSMIDWYGFRRITYMLQNRRVPLRVQSIEGSSEELDSAPGQIAHIPHPVTS